MTYIEDTYSTDATKGGRDAYRITLKEALYWWKYGLATPVSGDDMYRPSYKKDVDKSKRIWYDEDNKRRTCLVTNTVSLELRKV